MITSLRPCAAARRAFAFVLLVICHLGSPPAGSAQVPGLLNYQGRVLADGVPFNGSGQFKFALVNGDGSVTHWSNDGTGANGAEPTAAATISVAQGTYSVLLGDTTLANMTAVPATVFANSDVRLRVWFNDGTHGFQRLTPDQRIAAVGYALAANVPDGAVTAAKLAPALDANLAKLNTSPTFAGTVTAAGFSGPVSAAQLSGTVNDARLSPNIPRLDGSPTFTGTVTAAGFEGPANAAQLIGTVNDARLSPNIPRLNSAGTTFTGPVFAQAFSGNGAGLVNLNAAALQGSVSDAQLSTNVPRLNSSVTFAGNLAAHSLFSGTLGTTNPEPVVFQVNDRVGLRLTRHYEWFSATPNVIGGHEANSANAAVGSLMSGATIGGGGDEDSPNRVLASYGTVSGGRANEAGGSAVVGGGELNRASSKGFVGGGERNIAGNRGAVGGGSDNQAGGGAFIGGGQGSFAEGDQSAIGGGFQNRTLATRAFVGGGYSNLASGELSAIAGGKPERRLGAWFGSGRGCAE